MCGSKGIWRSFGQTVDRCPGCNYRFQREEGYWVGALSIAIGISIVSFFVIFVGGLILTAPDVAWTGLLIVSLVAMGLGPLVLYPHSKTIWMWVDLRFLPNKGDERDWEGRS